MKTNAELTAINPSEYVVAIANVIQGSISGRVAGPELIEWVKNNIDKVSKCGWNNYNCKGGEVRFDSRKEADFDALLDIVQPLKLA